MPTIAIIVVVLIIAVVAYRYLRPSSQPSQPPVEDYSWRVPPAKPKPASQIFTDEKHAIERGTKSTPPGWVDENRPTRRWSQRGAWYETEIVGESNYQANIECYCTPGDSNIELTADLILENDNPHDKNAVMVEIGGRTVGYLSRQDAKLYRKLLKTDDVQTSYDALVRGTPGFRGVYLSLDMRKHY